MRVLIFIITLLVQPSLWAQSYRYKGYKNSLIQWEKIDPIRWMEFKQWKKELEDKNNNSLWRISTRELELTEPIGRVLGCSGSCVLHRGLGFSEVSFRSLVLEGDELSTKKDSYLWVFLFDGTLVRLSAESSISLQEINISDESVFLQARINEGNVLWMNRSEQLEKIQERKETDVTFLPLKKWFESRLGVFEDEKELRDDELFSQIELSSESKKMYQRLHGIKAKNNRFTKSKTFNFLVMPNGSVVGENLIAEIYVLKGNQSYVKIRENWAKEEASFHFRGYRPQEKFSMDSAQWYEVEKRGREIKPISGGQFRWGEFLTSNIPSILLRRETMLKKYSDELLVTKDKKSLAESFGYRKWEGLSPQGQKPTDLSRRIEFLLGYTTKMETSMLALSEQFRRKHQEMKDFSFFPQEFDDRFFKHALIRYYQYKE